MKWPPCVVTYVDLAGMKRQKPDTPKNSRKMRELHRVAQTAIAEMLCHHVAYCWNDSVLLHAYCKQSEHAKARDIFRELAWFLERVEAIGPCYAISVQGQAFPVFSDTGNERCVVLKTASYAMANCFAIEDAAKKLPPPRPSWYVDSRLRSALGAKNVETFDVEMLPTQTNRAVLKLDRSRVEALVTA